MDPFASVSYSSLLNTVFNYLRPNVASELWAIIQHYYSLRPEDFVVICPLHQNDETDRLHFSVELNVKYGCYRFHIYGFYKGKFIVTEITYTCLQLRTLSSPSVLADFRRPDSDANSVATS